LSDGPSAAPNLGLVASTDGAFRWESVSLREEVDFHDLEAAELPDGQLQTYGYDAGAGTVRASNDTGVTWTTGAKLDLRDLAVDPATSDRVFATTANGLVVSNDARSSFMPVPDAPALYLLTITPNNGELIGIDTEGTVWTSPDAALWTDRSRVAGQAEALTYIGGGAPWILIADERCIVATNDYGATVTVLVQYGDASG
jgi:hypothetical protein